MLKTLKSGFRRFFPMNSGNIEHRNRTTNIERPSPIRWEREKKLRACVGSGARCANILREVSRCRAGLSLGYVISQKASKGTPSPPGRGNHFGGPLELSIPANFIQRSIGVIKKT